MSVANYHFNSFLSKEQLANQLADEVVQRASRAISAKGKAIIALSGGSTPKLLFKELAARSLDWSKVIVTLVDERWVDEAHELSNAAFMKRELLDALDVKPTFIPLFIDAANVGSVDDSLPSVLDQFYQETGIDAAGTIEFDITILGMGGDGHTASFFPDANNIEQLLDADSEAPLLSCESPSTQVPRITWNLNTLLSSRCLVLHFTGADKKAVFEQAAQGGKQTELPIRSIIFQQRVPLHVFYAD